MIDKNKASQNSTLSMTDSLKGWVMGTLTLVFVLLYVAAPFGLIEPLKDESIISRLQPIIFVIIGYYFGRLPAQANEKTLKNEINGQSQKADAAQQLKEKSQQEKEALEEKINNTKITLASLQINSLSAKTKGATASPESNENANRTIETAQSFKYTKSNKKKVRPITEHIFVGQRMMSINSEIN